MSDTKSSYERLASVNVNEKLEKKGNLSYLSWAWAVDQLMRADPKANWAYSEPTLFAGDTMMVHCTVTAFDKAMSAQEDRAMRPQFFSEIRAMIHIGDEHIGVAKPLSDIPDRDLGPNLVGAEVNDVHGRIDDREGKDGLGMAMHDTMDIRPRRIDGGMYETLEIGTAIVCAVGFLSVQIENHEVVAFHEFGA